MNDALVSALTSVGKYIAKLYGEIKQLDGRISTLEHKNTSGSSAAMPHGGRNKGLCPMIFYPVKVSNVAEDGTMFSGTRQIPGSSGWEDDPDLTNIITVDVSSPSPPPRSDDVVLANFVGAVEGIGKYSFFDRMVEVTGAATETTYGTTVNPCCHIYFSDDFIVLRNSDDEWQSDISVRTPVGGEDVTIEVTMTVLVTLYVTTDTRTVAKDLPYYIQYGKALEDWSKLRDYVTCTPCQQDGTLLAKPDIRIYLYGTDSMDPCVFTGEILGYIYDGTGYCVCVTDCMDNKVDTIKHFNAPQAQIPYGWGEVAGGKILLGVSDREDEHVKSAGGYRWHGLTENSHLNHDPHKHLIITADVVLGGDKQGVVDPVVGDAYTGVAGAVGPVDGGYTFAHNGPYNDLKDTDNRPRYYALYHIRRVDPDPPP